jgi:hypothetical protein
VEANGRPLDDEQELAVAHLGQHPAWPVLRIIAQTRMEAEFRRTASEMLSGKEIPGETIAYRRGFFAGMKFLLDNPTIAAARLDEAIRQEQEDKEE